MKIIVVGSGPAGISAAIYAARAGMQVLAIGRDGGALEKSGEVENYYGFPQPVSGAALAARGQAQARRLGAAVLRQEVVHIGFEDGWTVKTTRETHTADAVILATGASRQAPKIEGMADYEGRGVSWCAVCDAFFYRGRDVAVLGCGEYALHEAMDLLPVAASVTMLTNGEKAVSQLPEGMAVIDKKVTKFAGGGTLERVLFADGSALPVSGVFMALGVAGSTALARQIGAAAEGGRILVNERLETNIPGLYAAGDCTGGLLQIAKAVHEGAQAAMHAVNYLRGKGLPAAGPRVTKA